MTHTTKSFILTAAIISALATTSSAQYYAANTNISYNNTTAVKEVKTTPATETSTAATLAYLRSAQFVFDNLESLKKEYMISDIYFDLDKATVRPDAQPVLDDLAELLMSQPEVSLAVTAHCDSRMTSYNNTLAVKRAESAKAYLTAKGIDASRIVIEKNGRPSVKNPCTNNPGCTIAEQQLNRKTEFNIIYNNVNLAHVSSFND